MQDQLDTTDTFLPSFFSKFDGDDDAYLALAKRIVEYKESTGVAILVVFRVRLSQHTQANYTLRTQRPLMMQPRHHSQRNGRSILKTIVSMISGTTPHWREALRVRLALFTRLQLKGS